MGVLKEFPFCKYHDDGTIEVFGNESGSPEITGLVPSPDVNTKSGEERQKRYDEACNGIILQGYFIVKTELIRNKAFDKPGQKTTLRVVYRPSKNKEELQMVHSNILKIMKLAGNN